MAVAKKSGDGNPWQPLAGADPARRQKLGESLMRRRAGLGYSYRPAFCEERNINEKMVQDVENANRDNFTFPTLQHIARAYGVIYDSVIDVARGSTDEVVPAGPAVIAVTQARHEGADPGGVPPAPFSDPDRERADYPYAAPIWKRFVDMAGEGIAVTGERLFPDSPDDAKTWDGIGTRLDLRNRVWLIADLQRTDAARAADARPNAAGA